MKNILRYIGYVAFCPDVPGCGEIVSTHIRKTQAEANKDLIAHRKAGHPPKEGDL